MYFHIIVTVVMLVSRVGVLLDENAEKIMQDITMTAPSIHTPTYDFKNDFPINAVVSPANDERGTGAIAV